MYAFIFVSFLIGVGIGIEVATWLLRKEQNKHQASECLPPINTTVQVQLYFQDICLDCMLITYGETRRLKWQCVSGKYNGHMFAINPGDVWSKK